MDKTVQHKISLPPEELTVRAVFDFCQNLIDSGVKDDLVVDFDAYDGASRDHPMTALRVTQTLQF